MRRLAFSKLLLLVVLIPLIALALFASRLTYESWVRYDNLTRATSLLRLAVAASQFAGLAVPGEGAVSRDFLASGDMAKLTAQRNTTDSLYRAMREAAAANVVKDVRIDEHLRFIDEKMRAFLAARPKIDDKSMPASEVTGLLAPMSGRAIDLIGAAAAASDAIVSSATWSS